MTVTKEMIEAAAEAIYNIDPFEVSGEYVEGFLVSPWSLLTWSQAQKMDAEFPMSNITRFPYAAAEAALKAALEPLE
jgi:hypothetical protein